MEINIAIKALTALAHETRLTIFRILVQAGESGVAAGQLAKELNIPNATLSFHLKELTNAAIRWESSKAMGLGGTTPAVRTCKLGITCSTAV